MPTPTIRPCADIQRFDPPNQDVKARLKNAMETAAELFEDDDGRRKVMVLVSALYCDPANERFPGNAPATRQLRRRRRRSATRESRSSSYRASAPRTSRRRTRTTFGRSRTRIDAWSTTTFRRYSRLG